MNKKANEGKIILQRQDLRHLQWTKIRHSSGTAGSFLKATARIQGERLYNVDPLADRPVQCFVGSHSATENLNLIPKEYRKRRSSEAVTCEEGMESFAMQRAELRESDRNLLFTDLEEAISEKRREVIWRRLMHYQRALFSAADASDPSDPARGTQNDNNGLLQLFSVQSGGSGLALEEDYYISAEDLREAGSLIPVTAFDFRSYVEQNVVDTITAAELLHCTRQNIQDLVRRKKLTPVKILKNNFLFLREDLL